MIRIEELTKIYNAGKKNQFKALDNISLTISDGEFLAITGRSGAGKSTLLHILSGIEQATSGSVWFNDYNIVQMKDEALARYRNRDIGIVLQDFALVDGTVKDNLCLPIYFHNGRWPDGTSKTSTIEYAYKLADMVGLSSYINKKVQELSGGQKQRVAIARAMVNRPKVLLADEPTGALDQQTATGILDLLSKLNSGGTTIVIVTHDMTVASVCRKNVILNDGKIVDSMNC